VILLGDEAVEFHKAGVVLRLQRDPGGIIQGYELQRADLSDGEAPHGLTPFGDVRRMKDHQLRPVEGPLDHMVDSVDQADQGFVVGQDLLVFIGGRDAFQRGPYY